MVGNNMEQCTTVRDGTCQVSAVTKYVFNTKQVEFLGYIITPKGVVIDLVRV